MSYVFDNNVQTTVNTAILAAATSIVVDAASAPDVIPPDPAGGIALLTLVDSLNPNFVTKREIISYTGRTGTGPYTLTGVLKGLEGTADQAWSIGDYCFQGVSKGALDEAFQMDNMAEGAATKILTGTERTKLSGIATGADVSPVASVAGKTGAVVLTPADASALPIAGDALTGRLDYAVGAVVTAATTTNVSAVAGNIAHLSGVTPITAFTMNTGQMLELICDAATPLTYHSTTMKLNTGGVNYTTAAGDRLFLFSDGTTAHVNIIRQDGTSLSGEPSLGNPATDGDILSSTIAGVRSWATPAGGVNPNILINGNFDLWEDGTAWTAPVGIVAVADMFRQNHAGVSVQDWAQSTDVPTQVQSGLLSTHSLQSTVTTANASPAAGDFSLLYTPVEGHTFQPLQGNTGQLTFWVKSAVTGIHCVSFRSTGYDRSYIAEYVVNAANTWEKKTVSVLFDAVGGTWDYTTGTGLDMSFNQMCGTTFQTTPNAWQTGNFLGSTNQVNAVATVGNVFKIAQVKMEIGTVATSLRPRPYSEELALEQRYFRKIGHVATYSIIEQGYGAAGILEIGTYTFSRMRASPTSTIVGTLISTNTGLVSIHSSGSEHVSIRATVTANGLWYFHSNATNYLKLDARL